MTFEEFFLKKKIDLDLLKLGKPDVFAEFVSHYEQMSEKSFDHTKKYWFNNLRIAYPLAEEKKLRLKEAFKPKEETASVKEIVEPASENTQAASAESIAFKPRFKAPATEVISSAVAAESIREASPPAPKPAGFKPRFKAGATKSAGIIEEQPEEKSEEVPIVEKAIIAKPAGFKPRFKAGVTTAVPKVEENKPEASKKEESQLGPETITAKPVGFKPRFKAPKKEE
ncbi:hypothetical protein [Pedobacter arcticus]|uniref:hypothetical protein n=1 Tax=Pedobacter arcticus TaxID=752140 RepID=UPI0003141968|nr:hypothetical protein [Pedobacter arcticus]